MGSMKTIAVGEASIEEAAEIAAKAVLEGKVVVVPTDTVYGLVADATNGKAVRKVFQIKGRPQGKPLPIFIKDVAAAKRLAKVSLAQERRLRKSWPGKVTFVLKSRGKLARETGTRESIGLRVPGYPLVLRILQKTRRPLTGTSVNLAGKKPLSDGWNVVRVFQGRRHRPALLVDAGTLPFSRPSKVLDITKEKPSVVRK